MIPLPAHDLKSYCRSQILSSRYDFWSSISDSLSALQSITNSPIKANSSLSLLIITFSNHSPESLLNSRGYPAITQNETVDRLAKHTSISGSPSNTLPLSEIYPIMRRSTYDDWNIRYAESFGNQNSYYLSIQPLPPSLPWYTYFSDISRSQIIKLGRLRFGHNLLLLLLT